MDRWMRPVFLSPLIVALQRSGASQGLAIGRLLFRRELWAVAGLLHGTLAVQAVTLSDRCTYNKLCSPCTNICQSPMALLIQRQCVRHEWSKPYIVEFLVCRGLKCRQTPGFKVFFLSMILLGKIWTLILTKMPKKEEYLISTFPSIILYTHPVLTQDLSSFP